MTDDNDKVFLQSLPGVQPIKRSNKITKPLPKQKTMLLKKSIKLKKRKIEKTIKDAKKTSLSKELKIEKNSTNKKLKKGKILINKKIDLHGYSLEEAKQTFLSTVNKCFLNNHRCILFITGKGIKKNTTNDFQEKKLYYGKIRNNFLNWVSEEGAYSKILNVQQADIKNGGDGAFFVYLRKNKN